MNAHLFAPDTFKTPTQVQAERLADLEARLQLANEAYFYLQGDRNALASRVEMLQRKIEGRDRP
jgi:hypothetical protein